MGGTSFIITLWQYSEVGAIHSSSHYGRICNLVQSKTSFVCFLNELFNCEGHFLGQSFLKLSFFVCSHDCCNPLLDVQHDRTFATLQIENKHWGRNDFL